MVKWLVKCCWLPLWALGIACGQPGGGGEDCAVAFVEGGTEEEDCGDAADDLGEVGCFFRFEGAVKERRGWLGSEFAIAEPFLRTW